MRPHDETIRLMTAKLHRVRVTSTHKDYVGSVTIAADLLEAVGILPLEEVEIVNVTNGRRWSTYALPGPSGSGQVSPNGGGAWMCEPGDILIIFAYAWRSRADVLEKGHTAQVVVSNEKNAVVELLDQRLDFGADRGVRLCTEARGGIGG